MKRPSNNIIITTENGYHYNAATGEKFKTYGYIVGTEPTIKKWFGEEDWVEISRSIYSGLTFEPDIKNQRVIIRSWETQLPRVLGNKWGDFQWRNAPLTSDRWKTNTIYLYPKRRMLTDIDILNGVTKPYLITRKLSGIIGDWATMFIDLNNFRLKNIYAMSDETIKAFKDCGIDLYMRRWARCQKQNVTDLVVLQDCLRCSQNEISNSASRKTDLEVAYEETKNNNQELSVTMTKSGLVIKKVIIGIREKYTLIDNKGRVSLRSRNFERGANQGWITEDYFGYNRWRSWNWQDYLNESEIITVCNGLALHPKFKYCWEAIKDLSLKKCHNNYTREEDDKDTRIYGALSTIMSISQDLLKNKFSETLYKNGILLRTMDVYNEHGYPSYCYCRSGEFIKGVIGEIDKKGTDFFSTYCIPKALWSYCSKNNIDYSVLFWVKKYVFNLTGNCWKEDLVKKKFFSLTPEEFEAILKIYNIAWEYDKEDTDRPWSRYSYRLQNLICYSNVNYKSLLKVVENKIDLQAYRDYLDMRSNLQNELNEVKQSDVEEVTKYLKGINSNDIKDVFALLKSINMDRYPLTVTSNDNLLRLHDELSKAHTEIKLVTDCAKLIEQDKEYQPHYAKLKSFEYTDGEYSIIVPQHIVELVYEGNRMHHCVGSYTERVSEGLSHIVFLRKNEDISHPLVTIEINPVSNGNSKIWKADQIYAKYDSQCSDADIAFLKKWAFKKNIVVSTIRKMGRVL